MNQAEADLVETSKFLGSVGLFDGFNYVELAALASVFEQTSLLSGDELMSEGTPSDSFHLVVSGRLRAFAETESGPKRRGEIGRGEPIGEMGLLTGSPRTASVVAVRDSELLTLPAKRFDELVAAHPGLIRKLAASIIQRSAEEVSRPDSSAPVSILVIPLDPAAEAALAHFATSLCAELGRLGDRVATLSAGAAHDELLPLEREHDRVVLTNHRQGETLGDWTQVADSVLLLSGGQPIRSSILTSELVNVLEQKSNVELVFNHPSNVEPTDTAASLDAVAKAEVAILRHHHVCLADGRGLSRLARLTTQRGVGLVLGGGGARGLAHVGVIDELLARDIPIDAIIGTSAGAIVAANYGRGYDRDAQVQFLVEHLSRSPMDYTLPSASLAAGKRITRLCQEIYGDTQIEDMWVDTSTVSTNLTQDCLAVHDRGPLWRAVRASLSIPVLFPPMRIGDEIHVDGALGANVPIRQLTDRHQGITVIASDVGIDKSLGSEQLSESGVTTIKAGFKQWLPFFAADGPSVIRLIGRMVELSTGYGDQPEPALLIKHDLNDIPMFGFKQGFETAERGRLKAQSELATFEY